MSHHSMPRGSQYSIDDDETYNIEELFSRDLSSSTTSDLPRTSCSETHDLPSLLDLPTEIRLQIYEALLLVSRKHPAQRRLRTAREEGREIRKMRHESEQKYYVYKNLKTRMSPFPAAVQPPALALMFTCSQVYAEYAPVFYSRFSIVIAEDVVRKPGVFDAVVPPPPGSRTADDSEAPASRLRSLSAPPLLLIQELYIYVSTPTSQSIARMWIESLRRIAETANAGRLRKLTFVLDHRKGLYGGPHIPVCPSFKDDDWDGSIIDDEAPRDKVELSRNKALARALARFGNLAVLVVRGLSPWGFPEQLDEHLDKGLVVCRAGRHRGLKRVSPAWHRGMTMKATYVRRGAVALDGAVLSGNLDGTRRDENNDQKNGSLADRLKRYKRVRMIW
ncbi:hypothetical protein Micbo1qcDRAFT_214029 [Microdochium bolleyi]|uniref:F-box domain-containing protein n=1 Tax=Microdochium bolleyi TaxID=196109 RepID=A0A136IVS6_9PEZI|nr:hypothetical protein Micbo1qcDRAFT_214029 [Microdochium bolleyi]